MRLVCTMLPVGDGAAEESAWLVHRHSGKALPDSRGDFCRFLVKAPRIGALEGSFGLVPTPGFPGLLNVPS